MQRERAADAELLLCIAELPFREGHIKFGIKRALMTFSVVLSALGLSAVREGNVSTSGTRESRRSQHTQAFVPPCRSTNPTRPISLPSRFIREREKAKKREMGK